MVTKTALVTGSAGFIGRHMVRELESRGYSVSRIDVAGDKCYHPVHGWYHTDAVDLFRDPKFDPVFDITVHAAYHVGGRAAIDGTNTNFAKNLQLDAAMFEWAVRTKQRRVLYFSSSAAYPVELQSEYYIGQQYALRSLHEDLIDLEYPIKPDANYGWAKLTGERLTEDARRNGLNVSVVRPFSGYGEDQDPDEYPFPAIVHRASHGDLSVWGPPGQSRDWIHVDDLVRGALAVVESGTLDAVNLCTGVATEMGELAQMVYAVDAYDCADCHTAPGVPEPTYLEDKPYGVFYRVGNPDRMLQCYTPKVSLEEGIRRALRAQQ